MTSALAIVVGLLLAADDTCHFVTNTRILVLPTCDIGPATIAELTEDPSASTAARARSQLRRPAATGRRGQVAARGPSAVLVVRGNEELERRVEQAQRERIDAVADRLAAEHARDVALRERDAARRDLAAALAALREGGRHASASRPAGEAGPDAGRLPRRAAPDPE